MDSTLDDSIVTLGEVLKTEEEMVEDANAVLGAGDDKNCTYNEGYVKRQALYACLTCNPVNNEENDKRAGICLACCYHCHDGHNLVELYTKRNFRCDCGNGKFDNFTCNLLQSKDELNVDNKYNQNFSGVYCICARPYPDPDDKVMDDMIQCVICEDWFHTRHLECLLPPADSYAEMICKNCVKEHPFLLHYQHLSVDVESEKNEVEVLKNEEEDVKEESKMNEDEKVVQTTELNENDCKKPLLKSEEIKAMFWSGVAWRQQLCTCKSCMEMYEEEKVHFIIDPSDTVQYYEEKGKVKGIENAKKIQEDSVKFLNSVDRVPLLETLAAYEDLKKNLRDYLKKFAENKKVVREEDIREFFSEFEGRKKRKLEVE